MISVVVDNEVYREGLEGDWGFSCIVKENERTILFDTGPSGIHLLQNLRALDISPKEVDVVVLSHNHFDHTGGLPAFLEENNEVTLYLPHSFPEIFKDALRAFGTEVVEVQGPLKICEGVYSTGEMEGPPTEQSLVIQSAGGGVLITGCAHPGILNVIQKGREILQGDLVLALGGFHLFGLSFGNEMKRIINGIRDAGVMYVGPCHCTGEVAQRMFEWVFGDSFLRVGAGRVVHLDELR